MILDAVTAAWSLRRRCEVIARFWGLHWSAIQLTILREKGERDLATFKQSILRRHQRSHFMPGVAKLGIDRSLPPAVIAGRYHYFSNAIGGLAMEYVEETPRKVWIRYLPPAWSFPGQSLFAVPVSVERAMFAGWHPFNGRSLGCRRLGFVVTKVFQEGEPYDEGYFIEHDRDLDEDECLQFVPVTVSPDFDAEAAPRLDPALWPEERLVKAKRGFARGYVEDAIETALQMYGVHQAAALIAHAARVVAIQFLGEFKTLVGVTGSKAEDLVAILAALSDLAGDHFAAETRGDGVIAVVHRNRLATRSEIGTSLAAFALTAAKVMSPRIRLTLDGDHWSFADTPDRLF